jgi:hypothetical protein
VPNARTPPAPSRSQKCCDQQDSACRAIADRSFFGPQEGVQPKPLLPVWARGVAPPSAGECARAASAAQLHLSFGLGLSAKRVAATRQRLWTPSNVLRPQDNVFGHQTNGIFECVMCFGWRTKAMFDVSMCFEWRTKAMFDVQMWFVTSRIVLFCDRRWFSWRRRRFTSAKKDVPLPHPRTRQTRNDGRA